MNASADAHLDEARNPPVIGALLPHRNLSHIVDDNLHTGRQAVDWYAFRNNGG
jgi:hypothetical protein